MEYIYLLITLLAISGAYIAGNVIKEKKKEGPMVCPIGFSCKEVVTSQFSKILGIDIAWLGFIYYSFSAILYGAVAMQIITVSGEFFVILWLISCTGFLFSLYLTFIQAFTIKQWCSWCLCSAVISILMFVLLSIHGFAELEQVAQVLVDWRRPIIILHLLGFALGVGGATINDIFFMRFLKDFKINNSEHNILKIFSQIIWFGLAISVVSGFGLYLANYEILNETPKFLVKTIVVIVIIVNGAFLNLLIAPRLTEMPFAKTIHITSLHSLRKLAFALGAISFVSWYSAFILGSLRNVPFSFIQILGTYIILLVIGIIASQVGEYLLLKKSEQHQKNNYN